MTSRSLLLPALLAAVAASGCSTLVLESHRLPVEPKLSFEKTVVIVIVPDRDGSERARRAAENELAGLLAPLNVSPSYRLIALEDLRNADQIKSWAVAEGFDGLVVIWLEQIKVRQFVAAFGPTEAVRFLLKASVLSLKDDREIWTGVVEQRDPFPLTKNLPDVARAVARTLRDEGLTD